MMANCFQCWLGWATACLLAHVASWNQHGAEPGPATVTNRYELRADHDANGTGKFYLGREMARIMGHQAADWLERPERDHEERPDLLVEALRLKAGDIVADIGAGTGYYTRRMAEKVGEKGLVYAVDIQPEMLQILKHNMQDWKLTNYRLVQSTESDPKLPEQSADLILMVDVYHEFTYPFEMMQAICRALKPGGRVALVEFRSEDAQVPIKAVHKMSEAQVRREMALQPLVWVETIKSLPWQHVVVFKKK